MACRLPLSAPGSGQFHIGKPDVPIFGEWIVVPNGTSLSMRVEPGEPVILEDIDLPPVQAPQANSPRGQNILYEGCDNLLERC